MTTNWYFTEKNEARLALASLNRALKCLDRIVFTGTNKIEGLQMWCAVTKGGQSTLRPVRGQLTTEQYVSYMEDVILPMWSSNQNLIFVQVSCLESNK